MTDDEANAKKIISDQAEIESILTEAQVMNLAMCRDDRPYILPLNFGYKSNRIYFHGGLKGQKMDIIKVNPRVGFTVVSQAEIAAGDIPCFWTCYYRSVVGFGNAVIVEDKAEKTEALAVIAKHYAGKDHGEITPELVPAVGIIRLDIETMTAKVHERP